MAQWLSENYMVLVLFAVVILLQGMIMVRQNKKTEEKRGQFDRLLDAIDQRQLAHRREVRMHIDRLRQRNQMAQDHLTRRIQQDQQQLKEQVQDKLQEMTLLQQETKNAQTNAQVLLQQSVEKGFSAIDNAKKLADSQLQQLLQVRLAEMARRHEKNVNLLRENVQNKLQDVLSQQSNGVIALQKTLNEELDRIRKNNAERLEKIQETVNEKLEKTLSDRLTHSFQLVDGQLAKVQRGLGEMRVMAQSVRDLRGVLTNVKTRGNFGEVQLEYLLSQLLHPSQYAKQFRINPETRNMVDFAIRLPGRIEGEDCWLPVDSKFPTTAFDRLMRAGEKGETKEITAARKELGKAIEKRAKSIQEKYIVPGLTTDFAVMYLPSEGLYSEVLRIEGLFELLQEKYHITPAGPTVIGALLNSLQMGFVTLAVEKRSSEIWHLMGDVKKQFASFTEDFEKVSKLFDSAYKGMDALKTRNNKMTKVMKKVEISRDVSDLFTTRHPILRNSVQTTMRVDVTKSSAS